MRSDLSDSAEKSQVARLGHPGVCDLLDNISTVTALCLHDASSRAWRTADALSRAYALSAAKALSDLTNVHLDAKDIAIRSMSIAAELCIYTNSNFTIESL